MSRPTISLQAAIGPGSAFTNAFIIGQSLIGGTDLISGGLPIGSLGSWQEIGDRCANMSIRSGRQRRLEEYRASTLIAELGNEDGALDPSWTAGPYTDGGVTRIVVNAGVRAIATWAGVDYPLYYGFADSWKPVRSYPEGGMVGLAATDAFKIFARIVEAAQSPIGAGDLTGARINRILDLIGWDVSLRDIDPGTYTHQATTLAGSLLAQLQLDVGAARGAVYMDPTGKVAYRDSVVWYTSSRVLTSQWTIGDGATEVSPAGFEESRDDNLVYNDVNVARVGGAVITRRDPAVATLPYLWSSYNRTDLTLETDLQVISYAEFVLRTSKTGGSRVDSITFEPDGFDDLWPMVLGARKGDRLTVNLTHPYTGVRFLGDYFIEGIDHDIPTVESGGKWVAKFSLSDASAFPTNPFIIGRSLIGGPDLIV